MSAEYNSTQYKKWRDRVYKRDKYTCRLCGQRGKLLNAHHIRPKALYTKLTYILKNGITLCVQCHEIVTGHESVFEELFTNILHKRLTLEYVYNFFNMLCIKYPKIVRQFKAYDKWLKIPAQLIKDIKRNGK